MEKSEMWTANSDLLRMKIIETSQELQELKRSRCDSSISSFLWLEKFSRLSIAKKNMEDVLFSRE